MKFFEIEGPDHNKVVVDTGGCCSKSRLAPVVDFEVLEVDTHGIEAYVTHLDDADKA